MRETTLLSPGQLSQGHNLRRVAAAAISSCEIVAGRTAGGKTRAAAQLQAFFTDAASKLAGIADAVSPTMAGATATVNSATQITVVFAETMDTSVTPAITAFTVNNGGTVSAVAWVSGNLRITGTGYAAGDTLAYVQPGTNGLRDLAGNLVASGNKVTV